MYLKALEIQGFKSFPEKTRLTFEKNITAIVGPNGSGKSNISDAILWVMGEQRTRTLRGGKMEDVIFGGTEKRGKMGFAQVSLIIDNSKHIFDLDNSEIMITRRYYRSGESEYYINRESVRLRDITELLMDTGLGRDGYSIIGQGRIAEIVSGKSTDRREIFEEAAGISRYRHRKEEAERKLAKTDENLVRINDKIDELELQVNPLREQAETAKRYLLLRDELRGLEISVWMENLDKLRAQGEEVAAGYENARAELEKAHEELNGLYARRESISEKMREKDLEVENSRQLLSNTEALVSECDSAAAVLRANIENNLESMERIKAEISEQRNRARGVEQQITERKLRIDGIAGEKERLSSEMEDILTRSAENVVGGEENDREISALAAREAEKSSALAQCGTALSMLADSTQELLDRESGVSSDRTELLGKLEEGKKRLASDKERLSKARERVEELNNIIAGYRLRVQSRERTEAELSDRHTRLTIDSRSLDSRIEMLSKMEKEYEGFSKAVKSVMREAQRGALRGIHGPVANLVHADDRFALAIETALGAAMQNIVVDDPDCGRAAIEMLKRRDSGRGTFCPISTMRGSSLQRVPRGEPGFLGIASQIAQYDAKYKNVFENLLGRVVIAETLQDAIRIAAKYNNSFRVISLDGQVVNTGGSMTGGSTVRGTGMISRANELKRLKQQREKLGGELSDCGEKLATAKREAQAARYEMETASDELKAAQEDMYRAQADVGQSELLIESINTALQSGESEKKSINEKLAENDRRIAEARQESERLTAELEDIRAQLNEKTLGREQFDSVREQLSAQVLGLREKIASLDAEKETLVQAIAQLEALHLDLSGDSESRAGAIGKLAENTSSIEQELLEKEKQLAQLSKSAEELRLRIKNTNDIRLELEGERSRCEKESQDKNRQLLDLERIAARFEQKKQASDMEERQIVDKLWENYELSLTVAQGLRQPVESLSKANRRLSELKREINSLGNPNLGAIDEYERVSIRYNFLTEQRDDVEGAKKELLKVISELTADMKRIFVESFRQIDESFRETFLELFGGGRASLELEDEDNVLDCGIEIKVQPPGKALSTISLMSGGEMAFVAIALYFAILKVRPTPFCVMDEIDAALDEANVIRYAEYMRSVVDTQFVVITHRRGTMEEADFLYGVTMQEKGVSSVIAVDLEEAEKTIA